MGSTSTKKIVFAGNCQALALGTIYARHIAPRLNQNVTIVDFHPSQPRAEQQKSLDELRGADIVVEQIFDPPRLIPANTLPMGTRHAAFPTVAGKFLWPFSQHPHPKNQPGSVVGPDGAYPGEISCRQLNRLIEQNLPIEEAAERYENLDLAGLAHLDRFVELHLERQQERDQIAKIPTKDFIETHLRTEKLFLTPGHPTLPLFAHVAEHLFEKLGVPYSLTEAALRAQRTPPFPLDETPIHPSIAAHLRLGYVDETSTYRHRHEGRFSFKNFTRRYLAYVWNAPLAEGIQLAHAGQPEQAIPLLQEGLKISEKSAAGWRALALAFSRQHKIFGAIEAVNNAIALDPADPENHATAAHIWYNGGKLEEAAFSARAAIKTFPLWPGGHRTLATILARRGDHAGASLTALWACDLAPGDPQNAGLLKSIAHASGGAKPVPTPTKTPPHQESLMASIAIDFGANGSGHAFLGEGWSYPEPQTTWTLGLESTINIPYLEPDQDYALQFSAHPAGTEGGRAQRAIFYVNGTVVGSLIVRADITLELLVPSAVFEGNNQATLAIALPDAISPAQLGGSTDQRLLALSFRRLTFRPFTQPKTSLAPPE